jgi:pimeloyl-ACP methyl ester carboxylesterase
MGAWTSAPWLARITAPTLVLTGADDRIVPSANARLLAHRIPNATLHVTPQAGHFALLADDPGESGDAVAEFLDAQDPLAQARGLLST